MQLAPWSFGNDYLTTTPVIEKGSGDTQGRG